MLVTTIIFSRRLKVFQGISIKPYKLVYNNCLYVLTMELEIINIKFVILNCCIINHLIYFCLKIKIWKPAGLN